MSILLIRDTMRHDVKNGNAEMKRDVVSLEGEAKEYSVKKYSIWEKAHLALLSSFMSGLVAGLAGFGGGVTDTTTMILLGVPTHIAVGTSELAMTLTNIAGVIAHGLLKNIDLGYAIPLTIGTIFGAQLGCFVVKRIKERNLKILISSVAFIFGIRMMFFLFF